MTSEKNVYIHQGFDSIVTQLKIIYSEKATKFCEISILLLSYVVPVNCKAEISQNFVDFSEYMNFTNHCKKECRTLFSFLKKEMHEDSKYSTNLKECCSVNYHARFFSISPEVFSSE